jgi:hypothetical protein
MERAAGFVVLAFSLEFVAVGTKEFKESGDPNLLSAGRHLKVPPTDEEIRDVE